MKKIVKRDSENRLDPAIQKFSKEELRTLLRTYAWLYMAVDGWWYLTVKEKLGPEAAMACDIQVWKSGTVIAADKLKKAMNLTGNDLNTAMMAFRVHPWFQNMEYDIEFPDRETAIMTIVTCKTLVALEKEGEGRDLTHCKSIQPVCVKPIAQHFNPAIEVRCLKLPPRKGPDEVCCRWEFTLKKGD
jgi:hypothetical protein